MLRVEKRVLRVDERAIRVGKRVLRVGEECYGRPGKYYHNIEYLSVHLDFAMC